MKKLVKKTAVSTKNFVSNHKGKILLGTIIGAQIVALRHRNEFIEEHGLTDEYLANNRW